MIEKEAYIFQIKEGQEEVGFALLTYCYSMKPPVRDKADWARMAVLVSAQLLTSEQHTEISLRRRYFLAQLHLHLS